MTLLELGLDSVVVQFFDDGAGFVFGNAFDAGAFAFRYLKRFLAGEWMGAEDRMGNAGGFG